MGLRRCSSFCSCRWWKSGGYAGGGEQRVDRGVGVGEAFVLGGAEVERDHLWALAGQGELGADEDGVADSELLKRVAEPRLAVIPSLARRARSVAAAGGGGEHERAPSEGAALLAERDARDDDPVKPRLDGTRDSEVVETHPDHDRIGGEDLADDHVRELARRALCGGALVGGHEVGR